jgi:hypothetical protein
MSRPAPVGCAVGSWCWLCLSLLLGWSTPASAVVFCVSGSASLGLALSTAESNGVADEIRIAAGTYVVSSGSTAFSYDTSESHALTIEGGWIPGCAQRIDDASRTVLSGSGARKVVRLFASGSGAIRVANLTIADGDSSAAGAGLFVGGPTSPFQAPFEGAITIERVVFKFNRSTTAPGALYVSTRSGSIALRGNVFVYNRCSDSNCSLQVHSRAPSSDPISVNLSGNTLAFNTCNLGAPLCDSGGALLSGNQRARIYGNLFAFHAGEDLSFNSATVDADLYYNNIEVLVGTPSSQVGTTTIANPGFVDALGEDFRLTGNSPVLDLNNAPLPSLSIDLDGNPRVVGSAPDLGAYEFRPTIFGDGFE